MPFYRYKCEECGFIFKLLQQNGNGLHIQCPRCKSQKAKRLLPRIGVIYKGNGYYTTDYRSKNKESKQGAPSTSNTEE